MGGDHDGLRNLDTGKSCTFEEAQAELRDPRAVTTLTPRALSDDKRKTTVTRLSQKALKLANTAVAADTKGNVKAALADYKSAVHFLGLALHVQRDSYLVDTGELQEFHRAYSERIEQLEAKLKGGGGSSKAPLPDAAADNQPSTPRRLLGSLFATRSTAAAAKPIAHDLARVRESMPCGDRSSVPGASYDGARRGRLSHAEAGRGFFVALQAAQEHLHSCEESAVEVGALLKDEEVDMRLSALGPADLEQLRDNAALRVQSHTRCWLARRRLEYMRTLCRLILLMDSRERKAARILQTSWREHHRHQLAALSLNRLPLAPPMVPAFRGSLRGRSSLDASALVQMQMITPRGDAMLDGAMTGLEAATPRRIEHAVRQSIGALTGAKRAPAHIPAALADDLEFMQALTMAVKASQIIRSSQPSAATGARILSNSMSKRGGTPSAKV